MKKLNSYFIFSVCGSLLLQSCYVLKPDSSGVSAPDYNQRIEITNPHYNRVMSPTGYGVLAASIAAGGYAGMQAKIVQTQKGTVRTDNKPVNAIIGAALGFGINMLGNKLFAKERSVPVTDFSKWVYSANKEYVPILNIKGEYSVFHKSAEQNFVVKNAKDLNDFVAAFPSSKSLVDVLSDGVKIVSRNDLVTIEKKVKHSGAIGFLRTVIIRNSVSTKELFSSAEQYGDQGLNIETIAVEKVSNKEDVENFVAKYPASSFKKFVFLNALKNCTDKEFEYLMNFYPAFRDIAAEKGESLQARQKSNYFKLFAYAQGAINTLQQYLELAKQTKNISYPYKQYDILGLYWDKQLANPSVSGNVLIAETKNLSELLKNSSRELKLDNIDVTGYIRGRLEDEVKSSVSISFGKLNKVASDEDWKHWQFNFLSDKIFQYQPTVDNVAGIYSATITNSSKFDLPVMVKMEADLMLSLKVGGVLGTAGNVLATLTEGRSMNEMMGDITSLGKGSEKYYDVIKAKSESDVLLPVRSKVPFNNAGLSLWGIYSTKYEVEAKNLSQAVSIADHDINQEVLKKQAQWAQNIVNGTYDAKLRGIISGKEYDIEEENEKWEDFMRRNHTESAEGRYFVAKNTDTHVSVLLKPNEETGLLNIYTDDDEESMNEGYSSLVYSKANPGKKSGTSNSMEDNTVNYKFSANDFPLIVQVNYKGENGKYISATITLNAPGSYEMHINK
jgi:hypothetical protein